MEVVAVRPASGSNGRPHRHLYDAMLSCWLTSTVMVVIMVMVAVVVAMVIVACHQHALHRLCVVVVTAIVGRCSRPAHSGHRANGTRHDCHGRPDHHGGRGS